MDACNNQPNAVFKRRITSSFILIWKRTIVSMAGHQNTIHTYWVYIQDTVARLLLEERQYFFYTSNICVQVLFLLPPKTDNMYTVESCPDPNR